MIDKATQRILEDAQLLGQLEIHDALFPFIPLVSAKAGNLDAFSPRLAVELDSRRRGNEMSGRCCASLTNRLSPHAR